MSSENATKEVACLSVVIFFVLLHYNRMTNDIYNDIEKACDVLRRGGIILYPTDTIWGIGCDARRIDAVRRVYEIKRRANSKAMLLLVADEAMLSDYVGKIPEATISFIRFADRPTTVIYPHPRGIAKNLLADDGSVGIRVTSEAYSAELCRRFGAPIVSTSANVSGQPSPRFFAEINDVIRDSVDFIAGYRRSDATINKASRIVKLSNDNSLTIIRE